MFCDDCDKLFQKTMSSKDDEIVSVKINCSRIYFWIMGKDKDVSLMKLLI